MIVVSEIKVYEVNGNPVEVGSNIQPVEISSVWNKTNCVQITWGAMTVTVLKKELLKAIENATDNP